jgi:uracil-DNA glycosylase
MTSFRDQLHPTWRDALKDELPWLDALEHKLKGSNFAPKEESILRAFRDPLDNVKVLILGQDPYPNPLHAMGLAFSVSSEVQKLPQSLKNIFTEYVSDTGFPEPKTGDLSPWSNQGVALMNRTLTVEPGVSNSHSKIGWLEFTLRAAHVMAQRSVVAILWGSYAQELGHLFTNKIESVHPSPLSAYRGFFGSKPFSRSNLLLEKIGAKTIDWRLP